MSICKVIFFKSIKQSMDRFILNDHIKDIESLFALDCLEAQHSVGKVKEH